MSTVDPTQSTTEALGDRLEFETLISDLSSRFIHLPPDDVDRAIEDALRRVSELLGIDFAVLWQWSSADPDVIAPTHLYCAEEGLQPPQPLEQELFPWCRQQMLAGRVVVVSTLMELPAEAAVDRESCRLLGIQSNLTLPLSMGGEPPVGALGFNAIHSERVWPHALVKRLQLIAQVFTNALARRRHEQSLQKSEERLALAADSAEAGLWTLDYRTGVFWATQKARTIFGYSLDEVISIERVEDVIHPEDRELVLGSIERSSSAGEPVDVEFRIVHPVDGDVRWIASRGRPHYGPTGEPASLTGLSIDITDRRRAEEALRVSEARLGAGADLAGLGFYEVDFVRGVVYFDERLRDVCGVSLDRAPGLDALTFWLDHLHPDDCQRVLREREELHDGRLERVSIEYRYLHPERGEVWIQHLALAHKRDATGRALHTFGVLREVTERKRAEHELRDLGQRLIQAHEDERALLARELHDDLTQRLAVLAIDVGRAELAAQDAAQAQTMLSVREELIRLSEDVHALAYQLHPSILEELGLIEALRAECERLGRKLRTDLSLEFAALPAAVGKDTTLCLFRVAQEALNNVARHAGAGAASVSLREMDGGLLLIVRDEGVGFDPAESMGGKSLGLASMPERVHLLDGTLDIESAPGQGTSIIAWVPARGESR